MLLLTGATGRVGSALLPRLVARREQVRCIVRDPRRLGPERVRVQIALGDLADAATFRHALRGVHTVVHLAATERDQPRGTIEEIAGIATWRLLRAAERAGVEHFVFVSPLGATPYHRSRLHRAKALAERAVQEAAIPTTIVRSSLIYDRSDRRLALLELLAVLPVVPVTPTMARTRTQPVYADDLAACLEAVVARGPGAQHEILEVAGPQTLTNRDAVRIALAARGHHPRLVGVPSGVILRGLSAYQTLTGPVAIATRDEADMLAATMLTARGVADAVALGVHPRRLGDVLAR